MRQAYGLSEYLMGFSHKYESLTLKFSLKFALLCLLCASQKHSENESNSIERIRRLDLEACSVKEFLCHKPIHTDGGFMHPGEVGLRPCDFLEVENVFDFHAAPSARAAYTTLYSLQS